MSESRELKIITMAEILGPQPDPDYERIAEEVIERASKATERPWMIVRESAEFGTLGMPVCRMCDDEAVVVGHRHDWGPCSPVADDAQFVAFACSNVEVLARDVIRLRGLLRRMGVDPSAEAPHS